LSWLKASSFVVGLLAGGLQDPAKPDYVGTESFATLMAKTDFSCILRTWRLKGILACPSPSGGVRTCLWVENAYPCGILELVRQPGQTHIVEAAPVVKGVEGVRLFGATSSHTTASETGTGLQFTEGRVYTFVPEYWPAASNIPIARPQGSLFQVNYVSELDGFGWRTGLVDILADPPAAVARAALPSCATLPDPARCAGFWGAYFPRIGFVAQPSEVIAAYLLGLRAGRVAERPMARVVLSQYPFEPRTGHYVQMVRPTLRACVSIGFPNARVLETRAASRAGAYLFVHFGLFEECKGCLPVRLVGPRSPTGG